MKAAVRSRYGGPEVVRVAEVEKPVPKDNEVVVKVHATTVNRTDCGVRAAHPFLYRLFVGLRRPRLTILGNEFAGEVEAVGDGVRSFAPGNKVFGFSPNKFGAHAEYMVMPEHGSIGAMPANLSYEKAAPGTEGAHYALSGIRSARVQAGQDVLVYGATGAIGSAAVQLLVSLGAKVTAVCAAAHRDLVMGLGAVRVIDYTTEDFTRDSETYDLVIDAVGKSSFGRCRRLLRPVGSTSPPTWAHCPRTRSWPWSPLCSAAAGSCSRSRPSATRPRSCATSRT
jgi:NADPH:quinone reductase-like Zn-dependent oxidoreductase